MVVVGETVRRYILAATALTLAGCTNPNAAKEAVEAYGLTDVQTTGYVWFGCSDGDGQHTGFLATNVRGQRVSGVVCSGVGPYGKASTVRLYGIVSSKSVPNGDGDE